MSESRTLRILLCERRFAAVYSRLDEGHDLILVQGLPSVAQGLSPWVHHLFAQRQPSNVTYVGLLTSEPPL